MGFFKKGRTAWAIGLIAVCVIGVWWYQWLQHQSAPITVTSLAQLDKPASKERAHALIQTFKIDEAVGKADVIAEVEILNAVKEMYEPGNKTIFSAKVVQPIKGEVEAGSEIYIMQEGNSKVAFNDAPQFQGKEKYILILMKAVGMDNDDTYWILGSETGVYEVVDEHTVVKWAKPEEAFASIEASQAQLKTNKAAQTTMNKLKHMHTQFINKNQFEQMLRAEMEG
ncbi:hypothetical protein [Paenibacillus sp. IITD108]|uniref:hypothetical protein n=1 Tax=Paenibacillus sp. IITD108 TaxID=3116649 RepID=UPI002F3F4A65